MDDHSMSMNNPTPCGMQSNQEDLMQAQHIGSLGDKVVQTSTEAMQSDHMNNRQTEFYSGYPIDFLAYKYSQSCSETILTAESPSISRMGTTEINDRQDLQLSLADLWRTDIGRVDPQLVQQLTSRDPYLTFYHPLSGIHTSMEDSFGGTTTSRSALQCLHTWLQQPLCTGNVMQEHSVMGQTPPSFHAPHRDINWKASEIDIEPAQHSWFQMAGRPPPNQGIHHGVISTSGATSTRWGTKTSEKSNNKHSSTSRLGDDVQASKETKQVPHAELHTKWRSRNGGHIKKPLNAFMLFMKEMRAQVIAECTLKESAAINQILGRKWHALSREAQAKYYDMAKKEKELHQRLYPGWSARDNYASQIRRRNRALHNTMPICRTPGTEVKHQLSKQARQLGENPHMAGYHFPHFWPSSSVSRYTGTISAVDTMNQFNVPPGTRECTKHEIIAETNYKTSLPSGPIPRRHLLTSHPDVIPIHDGWTNAYGATAKYQSPSPINQSPNLHERTTVHAGNKEESAHFDCGHSAARCSPGNPSTYEDQQLMREDSAALTEPAHNSEDPWEDRPIVITPSNQINFANQSQPWSLIHQWKPFEVTRPNSGERDYYWDTHMPIAAPSFEVDTSGSQAYKEAKELEAPVGGFLFREHVHNTNPDPNHEYNLQRYQTHEAYISKFHPEIHQVDYTAFNAGTPTNHRIFPLDTMLPEAGSKADLTQTCNANSSATPE